MLEPHLRHISRERTLRLPEPVLLAVKEGKRQILNDGRPRFGVVYVERKQERFKDGELGGGGTRLQRSNRAEAVTKVRFPVSNLAAPRARGYPRTGSTVKS